MYETDGHHWRTQALPVMAVFQDNTDMRTKTLYIRNGERIGISRFPNFHASGSIAGMKRLYYGKNALLVRCGSCIYNVSSEPNIYYNLAH